MNTVIFDLDSTLADTRHRADCIPTAINGRTWWEYAERCFDDAPIEGSITLLKLLHGTHKIVILSLRPDVAHQPTRNWLSKQGIYCDRLMLLPKEEYDKAGKDHGLLLLWKIKMVQRLKDEGEQVVLAVDDGAGYEDAYRQVGVPCMTVMSPVLRDAIKKHNAFSDLMKGI